jgi:hypothetical protein
MIAISEKEKGIPNRGVEDRGRPRMDFVHVGNFGFGDIYKLAPVDPKERLLADEVLITPSKKWHRQQNRAKAKGILARAEKGQQVSDREIAKLQQRLLSESRVDALRGRESEGQHLSEALGELRRSRLVTEAQVVLAQTERGQRFPDRYMERLQERLLGMVRQDQLHGQESEGWQLAIALGGVRRSQLLAEAKDIVARARRGQRFKEPELIKLQEALGSMERQEEMLGQESEERWLVRELGEVRRSRLLVEAKAVLARAGKGRRFSKRYITNLQERLLVMVRQDQLHGQESEEEVQLATTLGNLLR